MVQNSREIRDRIAAAVLEGIPDGASRALEHQQSLPGYESWPADILRPGSEAFGRWCVQVVFVDDELPSQRAIRDIIEPLVQSRAELGIPQESVLQSVQLGAEVLWGLAMDAADRCRAPFALMRQISMRWMTLTNAVFAALSAAYRRIEREQSSFREGARAVFLQELLVGHWAPNEIARRATAFGLSASERYMPFRARGKPEQLSAIERELDVVLASPFDDDLAGILTNGQPTASDSVVIGLGPPATLRTIPEAFASASRALEAAAAFGLRGCHDLESLAFRPLILSEPELGESVNRRYVRPLEAMGQFGQVLLETISSFFDHGLRVEETARALYVHSNTLR
ncbi:MAG: PucR family transcriptional regulator, partial [bacterium]